MPYNIFANNVIDQTWNNKSEFQLAREKEAAENTPAPSMPVQPAMPVQQQDPPGITRLIDQGAQQSPLTAQQYKTGVIDYLMTTKGYSYEDAVRLMAPDIAAYERQEAENNEKKSYEIAAQLENTPIDSTDYRMNALRLLKLNPTLGKYYLKEGVGRRDIWNRATQRQQRQEDMRFNADLQFDNKLRWLKMQEAFKQEQIQSKIRQLVGAGMDERSATAAVLGAGGRGNGAYGNNGAVSQGDYKWAEDTINGLNEKLDGLKAENPNAQLSPAEIQLYNSAAQIRNLANQQRLARYGLSQQQGQQQKVNVNDYNQLKPMLQALVQKNGGKFDKNIAMLVRKYAGLDPNNNNPNEFVNEVFKNDYNFSG